MNDQRDIVRSAVVRVAPDLDAATLPDDADLRNDLGLDSLDFLHVVEAVHEMTGVDVPERDYAKIATVASFAEYLEGAGHALGR